MNSVLTKNQKKVIRKDYINAEGNPETLIVKVRYDDEYGNGHNTFAITGDLYGRSRIAWERTLKHASGATLWCYAGGCLHDDIAARCPEVARLIKWHMCSSDGPMHYVADTVWHAGDRDCHGLRAGEVRQLRNGKTGLPCWELVVRDAAGEKVSGIPRVDAEEKPTDDFTVRWEPWNRIGEGKDRNLDAARRVAVWPDATDEDLTAPGLEARLLARLPQLMEELKRDIEAFGFTF